MVSQNSPGLEPWVMRRARSALKVATEEASVVSSLVDFACHRSRYRVPLVRHIVLVLVVVLDLDRVCW
jgi:hypothetical protein